MHIKVSLWVLLLIGAVAGYIYWQKMEAGKSTGMGAGING